MSVALIALAVALGGTSLAALTLPKNSVGTKQIKNGAVTTRKIKNGAVTKAKLSLNGVTAPNATHAGNADTATNARHAANADTATIGTSPVAWARVAQNGTVGAARGLSNADVTANGSGGYCFHGLSFAFSHAAVTIDYSADGHPGDAAQFALGDPWIDCQIIGVANTQAEVATTHASTFAPDGFYIQFFN
jgi:hypothetical protein